MSASKEPHFLKPTIRRSLFTVGVAWLLWRLAVHWPAAARLRTAALYGIGSVAAWWSWLRIVAILG